MPNKNTRVWDAVYVLICGEGDARSRVTLACLILDKMNSKELPEDLQNRIEVVKNEAGKNGSLTTNDGKVLRDRYTNTSRTRKNKTYSKLATEIYAVYNELNRRDI